MSHVKTEGGLTQTHHNALCTCMVFNEGIPLCLNMFSVRVVAFYINPVFIWEECLERSGSLKRLIPTRNMGTVVKCCHQQLEGSGGDRWEVVWGLTGYYWLIKHKHLRTITNQGLQTFNTNDTCFIQNVLLPSLSMTVCFWLYKKILLKGCCTITTSKS